MSKNAVGSSQGELRDQEKLNGNNHHEWTLGMKGLCLKSQCREAITGFEEWPGEDDDGNAIPGDNPTEYEVKRRQRVDNAAFGLIFCNVQKCFLDLVDSCKSAKAAWDMLEKMCTSYGRLELCQFNQAMWNVKKTKEMNIHQYVAIINDYHRKIQKCGMVINDDMLANCYLSGLPSEWRYFIQS